MLYVIQVLAAILVGTAIGAAINPRNSLLRISSLIAAALGSVAVFMGSGMLLIIATAIFLGVQSLQRDPVPARA
jgi:diacylglycerol kinase